ncbi:hypothetical protein BB560_002147 [Smittium megazygosporum]|uniref:Major facilitator superfamily (MFS) profile domain-containing protein n=1 Tax=Smittium megazygosporum TaxID=133381 RepID=A0A2T9ZFQ6_9FUNG|nr:hypothetical protein BB560_002147 [Smittium megazygosporum]
MVTTPNDTDKYKDVVLNLNKEPILTPEEEEIRKSYVRKIDARILPVVVMLYFASSLDRGNIGVAMIHGLVERLKLSNVDQGNVVAVFTVFYLIFEAPANMILKKWKPRYWFTLIVTGWSLSTFYLAYAHTANLFIFGRVLVGTFEAGFTPGIVAYLSYWYTKTELASRMGTFFLALPLSGMIGGPIAGALVQTSLFEYKYQSVFFVEGLITIGIGLLAFFTIYDYPETSNFFTKEEHELVVRRITADEGLASEAKISRKHTIAAFTDWKIYVLSIAGFGPGNGLGLIGFAGPTIIQSMGYSPTDATYMAGIPYACSVVAMLIVMPFYDRIKFWKSYVLAAPVNIFGCILVAFTKRPEIRLYGLCLVGIASCPVIPIGMTWVASNCGSVSKRMISTAIYTTLTGLSGLLTPYMFVRKYAPDYLIGYIFKIVMQIMSLIAALTLYAYFFKENTRRDANPVDVSHLSTEEQRDMNDKHPDFRYRI